MKKILIIPLVIFVFVYSGCINNADDNRGAVFMPPPPGPYNWSIMNEGPFKNKISFATSHDLINWKDSHRLLAEHASVPDAIYRNGKIYVYFVDVSEDGIPERIGILTSDNVGKTWSDKVYANFGDIGNIVPVDPDPFVTDDGKIRLYYFDIEEERSFGPGPSSANSTNKIYSAISEDGKNFTQEKGIRFEKTGIFDPDVIKSSNGKYYMYTGNITGQKVIVAESNDGLNFTEVGTAFRGGAIPNVIEKDNQYYLFTGGIEITKSSNPTRFSGPTGHFQSTSGRITADPGVIQVSDDLFIMVYKYKN